MSLDLETRHGATGPDTAGEPRPPDAGPGSKASTLAALLAPGERVLYRDPKGWLPSSWTAQIVVVASLVGLVVAFNLGSTYLAIMLAFLGYSWGQAAFAEYTSEAVITDRRLLQKTGWRKVEITELPLAEIKRVDFRPSYFPGLVRIGKRNGGRLELHRLRRPQDFAAVLVASAKVARPALIGRLVNMVPYLCLFGGMPFTALLAWGLYLLAQAFLPESFLHGGLFSLLVLAVMFPVIFVGIMGGCTLAVLAGFAILRPWVSLEEARNCLCMKSEIKFGRWIERWTEPLYLKWAILLYGQPICCDDCAERGHG